MSKTFTIRNMILIALFAVIMSIGGRLTIPLPLVPFTLQLTTCALAGLLLGPRLGALSVGLYVAMGLVGLPVFAQGGGIGYVLKPSFGYLIGFIAAAFVIGLVQEFFKKKMNKQNILTIALSILSGWIVVYAFGLPWMYFILKAVQSSPLSIKKTVSIGMIAFLGSDAIQCLLAAAVARILLPVRDRLTPAPTPQQNN